MAEGFLKTENFEQIRENVMGLQVRVDGKAVMNQYSGRLEFNANSISELNADHISKEIIRQVEI